MDPPIVVIGAGPAGLACAAALESAGIPATVIEQGDRIGQAWRDRYDRLRLNTSRVTSHLPNMRFPRGTPLFPPRDAFVTHLEEFARARRLDIRTGISVERLERTTGRWTVHTPTGVLDAAHVIVATGYACAPHIPLWPGRDRFRTPLIHAAEYRTPEPYRDREVLVVGAGSSGMEIAFDLAEAGAARVRLAVRTPPNIELRSVAGLPGDPLGLALSKLPPRMADALDRRARRRLLGDLEPFGLPAPAEGTFARLRRCGDAPAVVDRDVIDAIREGHIEVLPAVESLDADEVVMADGSRLRADAVIAATGYRCGLDTVLGHLGVLDARGRPRVTGGEEALHGLRFVGFEPVPGQVLKITAESRRAAREIARQFSGRGRSGRR